MRVIELEEIQRALSTADLLPAIEQGFVAYAQGRAVVPPVGELQTARKKPRLFRLPRPPSRPNAPITSPWAKSRRSRST